MRCSFRAHGFAALWGVFSLNPLKTKRFRIRFLPDTEPFRCSISGLLRCAAVEKRGRGSGRRGCLFVPLGRTVRALRPFAAGGAASSLSSSADAPERRAASSGNMPFPSGRSGFAPDASIMRTCVFRLPRPHGRAPRRRRRAVRPRPGPPRSVGPPSNGWRPVSARGPWARCVRLRSRLE